MHHSQTGADSGDWPHTDIAESSAKKDSNGPQSPPLESLRTAVLSRPSGPTTLHRSMATEYAGSSLPGPTLPMAKTSARRWGSAKQNQGSSGMAPFQCRGCALERASTGSRTTSQVLWVSHQQPSVSNQPIQFPVRSGPGPWNDSRRTTASGGI